MDGVLGVLSMRLELKSIHCIETTAEVKDEPFFKITVDDESPQYCDEDWEMKDGWTRSINCSYDFNHRVRIELWEKDRPSRYNDKIGEFEVFASHERGSFSIVLPQGGADLTAYNTYDPLYRISYEVTSDASDSLPQWNLVLFSITCNNAQEVTDEIFIEINDDEVLGLGARRLEMKTGDTLELRESYPVTSPVRIELWEHDLYRNDKIGTLIFDITDSFDFGISHSYTFRRDRGIPGDASYTLVYVVTPMP